MVVVVMMMQKSLVTAMTTRRKQQQQMVQRAMLAEEDRRRAARKNFRMLTVPVCSQASCEPALLHSNADDHEDGENFGSFSFVFLLIIIKPT